MKHERGLAYAAFAVVCIVWGTTYLGIRIAIETVPPLLLTGARYTLAGAIMVALSRIRGERFPTSWRTLGNLALIGFLMVGVGNLAVVVAEQWVPSGMAALLVATAPFWITLLERMMSTGEPISRRSVVGMLVGFLGVALLLTPAGPGGKLDGHFILGAVITQLGSIGWQYGTIRSKYTIKGVPFIASAGLQMLFGGIIVDILGVALGEVPNFSVTPRTGGALLYLALFGSVLAYSAYIFAITRIRTTTMSLYAYINPAVAVVLGWLILDEKLTWVSIVAMAVILAGVAIVQTGTRVKHVSTAPESIAQETSE